MELEESPFEVVLPSSCDRGSCAATPLRYRPLYPRLFKDVFEFEWLADPLRAALEDGSDAALRAVLCEEVPGRVYSFDMLKPTICEQLLEELEHYESSGLPVNRPNSMNNVRNVWRIVWVG